MGEQTRVISPEHEEALRQLEKFEVPEWSRWIRSLLDGVEVRPELRLGEVTPDRILIWLFEKALKSIVNFQDAVGKVYESSTPARPEQLYYLLHAISVIRPEICKGLLLRHLKERRFEGVYFQSTALEPLALAARSRYGFSEELRTFIQHSAPRRADFGYRLASFRTLADNDLLDACQHMDLILPFLDEPRERKIFGGLLRGQVWAHSHQPLFEWYSSEDRRRLAEEEPGAMEVLDEVLRRWVVPWRPSRLKKDPYALLLSAQVFSGQRPFVAEELVFIARAACSRTITDERQVADTLRVVWDGTHQRMADWCAWDPLPGPWQGCLPWLWSPDRDELFTNWKVEVSEQEGVRELCAQLIKLDNREEDNLISSVLSKGERAMPREVSLTSGEISIQDEVVSRLEKAAGG